jgi:peptidoglycan-associated lipoprotein
MRLWIKHIVFLSLTIATVSARAQSAAATRPETPLRADFAVNYSYLRSNAPPGGCTCFNMNGVSFSSAWPLKTGRFAIAGDVTVDLVGNVSGANSSLTITTFTAGARYLLPAGHSPLLPFAEALVGGAHASGNLTASPNPLSNNAGLAFAAVLGGGVDLKLGRRFSWRTVEADYLPTTFDNGSSNHQNNFRVATGFVVHF